MSDAGANFFTAGQFRVSRPRHKAMRIQLEAAGAVLLLTRLEQLPDPEAMEWLKTIGIAGFLFFLIKGLLWLLVFALISRGLIRKEAVERFKQRFRILPRRSGKG